MVKSINLKKNNIRHLNYLANPNQLTNLDISHNRIVSIFSLKNYFNFKNLISLNLEFNFIEEIPKNCKTHHKVNLISL